MSFQTDQGISPLSNDIFYDILTRVDGTTLARAACSCATFSSISKEEKIWEDVCHSLWPSTNNDEIRKLIKTMGGFRRFHADCYPLIVCKDLALVPWDSFLEHPGEWSQADYYNEYDEYGTISPSDFVSLVDLKYDDQPIFSKVLWSISESDVVNRWFYNSPFRLDLLYSDEDQTQKVILSTLKGLPLVHSIDTERKEGKLRNELRDKLRLSWIIVNKRVNQAVSVSSWIPLGVQRHWPTDDDFLVRFGSVLPAEDILPCQMVECILLVKFRMVKDSSNGCINLELTQVSMQLEDMEGSHVNGRNSLMVLKKALSCKRSRNISQVLECCSMYSRVRTHIKEEKMRNESRTDRLCILSGIAAVITFWLCIHFSLY